MLYYQNIIAILLIVYAVYHITSFPSVPGGDSGELLAESCLLGTAHPPGYPLFTILSFFVSKFKVPRLAIDFENHTIELFLNTTSAWQVNNLCCVLSAFSATMIGASTYLLAPKKGLFDVLGIYVAAFLYSFSPLVWEYSIGSEVFALNNALTTLLVFLFIHLQSVTTQHVTPISRSTMKFVGCLGAFTCGLSLSNQHSSLLLIIVLVPIVIYLLLPILNIRYFIQLSLSGLLGLSPYLYLYFASLTPKPGSWGDMTSLTGLLRHMVTKFLFIFQISIQ